jgi:hypothetical protein
MNRLATSLKCQARASAGPLLALLGLGLWTTPTALAAQTINSTGGTTASNGIRVIVGENTQLQIVRLGTGQLYSPSAVPPSTSIFNSILLAHGSNIYRSNGNAPAASGGSVWTNVSQSAVTGTGTAQDPYTVVTVVAAGSTGITLTETVTYAYPEGYFVIQVDVSAPSTNTSNIKLYHLMDTYLAGGDNGPAYVDNTTNPTAVGTSKMPPTRPLFSSATPGTTTILPTTTTSSPKLRAGTTSRTPWTPTRVPTTASGCSGTWGP